MTLGDIIRNYRENNNITLGEFANACSLSKGYISMLENNINPRNNKPISPTLPSMAKVASGMGIDLDTLLKMLDKNSLCSLYLTNSNPHLLSLLIIRNRIRKGIISVYPSILLGFWTYIINYLRLTRKSSLLHKGTTPHPADGRCSAAQRCK